MSKRNKIIYWIATLWLALGMVATGYSQLSKEQEETDFTAHMGYPTYFLTILGIWKLLGAIAVLIPKFPLVKEWAYAGFFFVMTGAALSHMATGTMNNIFPSLLLLALTITSWYFRPADRKTISVNQ
ncbi:DoxX family protein [Chitinophaga sp. RCC_12]|uniref:DoxX family protein n=1 Tax=Chitinophaga sp. RCC_12 TaxID=3239226 RepID=UPI0035258E61